MAGIYRFSAGPWNISEGADSFGPPVRQTIAFVEKVKTLKRLGFDAVQFHDDDAVPDINTLNYQQVIEQARQTRLILDDFGLKAEIVAPRLWEDPRTIDGSYTSNDPQARIYALERSKQTIDIAHELGTNLMVLWLAREGTYIREAKDSKVAVDLLIQAINEMLEYDSEIRIAIEPKPNEPMDQAYLPTAGHAIALAFKTIDPDRVGVNIESAHAILAGLDPSDEMGFALAFQKLWTVHLNDQNGLKFDEDKAFGSVDLRRAFNQVRILEKYNYGQNGEYVGLDVKAMRTQKVDVSAKHLSNSKEVFLRLVKMVRSLNNEEIDRLVTSRDYDQLDWLIVNHLLK